VSGRAAFGGCESETASTGVGLRERGFGSLKLQVGCTGGRWCLVCLFGWMAWLTGIELRVAILVCTARNLCILPRGLLLPVPCSIVSDRYNTLVNSAAVGACDLARQRLEACASLLFWRASTISDCGVART